MSKSETSRPSLRKEFEQILDSYNAAQLQLNPKLPISYQSWISFEELFCFVKQVLSRNEAESEAEKQKSISNFPKLKSHLPPINLISFDGDITKWPLFYQQFKRMIHDNPNLNNSERVFYLVGKLTDGAAAVCAGLPATAENYTVIWNALIEKYDDPRALASTYLNKILQFKTLASNNNNALDQFINTFDSSVEALKQLKLDLTDFIFFHLATLKLDADTVRMFEIINRKKQIPSYKNLIDFVKEQSRVVSRGSHVKTSETQSHSKPRSKIIPTPSNKTTKSFVNTDDSNSSPKEVSNCVLCGKEQHDHLYKCTEFNKLTPKEKFDFIKKNSYCTNCTSVSHKNYFCSSEKNCSKCGLRHFSSLCFSKAGNSKAGKSNCSVVVNKTLKYSSPQLHSLSHTAHSDDVSRNTSSSHSEINIPQSAKRANAPAIMSAPDSVNEPHANNSPSSVCTISLERHDRTAITTLLGTAKIKIYDKYNRTHYLRCLVDPGSQQDYISIACYKRLSLPIHSQNRYSEVQGIGGSSQRILGACDFKFKSRFDEGKEYCIQPLVVERITSQLPDTRVDVTALQSVIGNVPLADDDFSVPGSIDLLLGVKLFCEILLFNKITGSDNLPSAIETTLGYIIMGDAPVVSYIPHTAAFCTFTSEPLDKMLERFWTVEEVPKKEFLSPADQECENIYTSTTTRNPDGSFAVDLPFKENPSKLGNSFIAAKRRYLLLEKRFAKSPELRVKYNEVIQDYLNKGIISKVSPEECTSPGFYLPHHPVIRNDKMTTRLRIVLDGSMKTDTDLSLNDLLHTGCNLQAEIFNILLNVRLYRIAFFADVRQMYLCIEVHPAHRRYQRILYRFDNDDPIETYEFNRVTFGLRSSPFLALRTLREVAKQEKEKWPLAAAVLERDIYMDDLASSAASTKEAVATADQLIQMFKSGGFDLVKWTSNSPELIRHIPQSHRQSEGVSFDEEHTFKILGLHWFPAHDTLTFFVSQPPINWTKRSILSATARLYDVLGLVGPVILYAKLIIKELWILKLAWDELPPAHIVEAWKLFMSELSLLSEFKIPRHLGVEKWSKVSLLAFADASEKAYGCVIYTHVTSGNEPPIVTLVCSKSRVSSPSQLVTLARLELNALVLLARLVRHVHDTLSPRHPIDDIYVFSDSIVALCWVSASPHRFQTYVANRISQFQTLLKTDCLHHIPGVDNPADCISRGLLPSHLLNHELWFNGPAWASLPINDWPIQRFSPTKGSTLPEEKTLNHLTQTEEENPLLVLSTKFSSWSKYLRAVVYVLRFLKKLPKGPTITASDLDIAEAKVIEIVQKTCFSEDIIKLKKGISCSSAVQKLHPFTRDGIVYVGGRLSHSSLSYSQKHPILLPKAGHIIDLMIDHYHRENLHAGPQLLLSIIRQRYWILSARQAIKKRIHKCIKCYKLNPKPTFPLMADLPPCRLEQCNAFTHTGVDYAGPLYITMKRGRGIRSQKSYLCIFICLVTKAVHFELAPDLTSASFLNLYKRFKSRSGACCRYIYSDGATNLVSSKGYLKELFDLLQSEDYYKAFSHELAKNRVTWKINPPTGSHFGGIWEANIRSAKTLLYRVIGNQILTYDEMVTVITQIEGILNSRPLYALSSDPSEPSALTPAHFLNNAPLEALPAPDLSGEKVHLLSRYSLLDKIVQSFWNRYRNEYLHTLQTREKWNTASKPINEGTVVIISNDNSPPLQWPLGIITRLFPGKDGVTRVAEVKTKSSTFIRPIVRLCPLPIN